MTDPGATDHVSVYGLAERIVRLLCPEISKESSRTLAPMVEPISNMIHRVFNHYLGERSAPMIPLMPDHAEDER